MAELILNRMASEIPADASSMRHSVAAGSGSRGRSLFADRRVRPPTPTATAEDFRFLRQIGSVIEAQTDLVKRSVVKLGESQALLDKVNALLRR